MTITREPWPPTLVELRRGDLREATQSGHLVQVGPDGDIECFIGDPETRTLFRSAVKPFTLAAAVAAGAADAFELTEAELAILASSHAGRDDQVELVRSVAEKAGVDLAELACGTEEPTDPETQERLVREGAELQPVQHMCSGFHMQSLLLARHRGWSTADYWRPEHPTQQAALDVVAAVLGRERDSIRTAWDDCGVLTYELSMAEMARAFLLLADPDAAGAPGSFRPFTEGTRRVRDAMLAHPDLINGMPPGTEDNVDTDLMRARPGCIVAKEGSGGMLGVGLLPGWGGPGGGAAGIALAIEGGDPKRVATGPAAVEALRQIRALDEAACQRLASTHVLRSTGPRGDVIAENVAVFRLRCGENGQEQPTEE